MGLNMEQCIFISSMNLVQNLKKNTSCCIVLYCNINDQMHTITQTTLLNKSLFVKKNEPSYKKKILCYITFVVYACNWKMKL